MLKTSWAIGAPDTIGMVASTMGTAPRRPAQLSRACSRSGSRNGVSVSTTESGRARKTSTAPITSAGTTAEPIDSGVQSRPSRTNMPICPIQARPSAKPRTAGPCGSLELPRITAVT